MPLDEVQNESRLPDYWMLLIPVAVSIGIRWFRIQEIHAKVSIRLNPHNESANHHSSALELANREPPPFRSGRIRSRRWL